MLGGCGDTCGAKGLTDFSWPSLFELCELSGELSREPGVFDLGAKGLKD
jgi:hypothetical protein